MTTRVAFYVRVSGAEQQKKGYSLAGQIHDLRKYCDRLPDYKVVFIVKEVGSGRDPNRPEINRLLDLAEKRRYDLLLVWKRDRLGRSCEYNPAMTRFLTQCGVRVESMMTGPQANNATTRFRDRVEDAVSELEVEQMVERCTLGKIEAAREGRWPLPVPPGWVKPQRWRPKMPALMLEVDEDQAWRVRRAFEAAAEGKTLREIADALGQQSHTTALGQIHNPIFKGEATYCGIPVPFPPIVTADLWAKAQAALDSRRRNRAAA